MSTVQGSAGPFAQVSRYGFNPQTGFYTTEVHIGTKANIRALIPGLVAANTAYDCQDLDDGAMSKLEIRYSADMVTGQNPTQAAVVDTWELNVNTVLMDLLFSAQTNVAGLSSGEKTALRTQIRDGTINSTLTGNALYFSELIKDGVTSVETAQPIIRHTQTVSSAWTGRASTTNAGRILTRATLQAEGVPATIMWNITDFSDASGQTRTGWNASNVLDYGWLKSWPSATQQTYNTWQIQTEYKFGLWPRVLWLARV